MNLVVNNLGILMNKKKFAFDMSEISDEQWLLFGENFLLNKECGNVHELKYMLDNSEMLVKFYKSKEVLDSLVANVNIQYLHRSGKLSTLNYHFDANGAVGHPFSEASECWQEVMVNLKQVD